VVTRTPEENRGTALALFTALFDLGLRVGGPLFGFVSERFGFGAMFAGAGVGLTLGSAVFFVWDVRLSRSRRRAT
jgi:predicted MFS family arabinose efflux permease